MIKECNIKDCSQNNMGECYLSTIDDKSDFYIEKVEECYHWRFRNKHKETAGKI